MQFLFYFIIGISIVFYVMLDGFDLGVGALHLFARDDKERRIYLNSIGPFWDGNEVWLIVISGGLLAGFPDVYATLFSGYYTLVMILLCGIIFRAVSIEFRSKHESKLWRSAWDTLFWLSSLIMIFIAGIMIGNLIRGLPVDNNREMYVSFFSFFNIYCVCVGVMSIFLFALHANLFLLMKTEGDVQKHLRTMTPFTIIPFYVLFILITIWTWLEFPYMVDNMSRVPIFYLAPIIMLLCMFLKFLFIKIRRYGWAFFASCLVIAFLFSIFAIGTYPNMIISSINPDFSLTLYNASASRLTLKVVLIVSLIGVPLVIAYGSLLYYVFTGKTKIHDHSY